MNSKIFFAGYIIVFLSACSVKEDLCAAYQCSAPVVNLKLKFTDSNKQDLLFSAGAVYSVSDLKIQNSPLGIDLSFGIDSMDKSNKYILLPVSYSQNFKIKLANRPEDNIEIRTAFQEARCCEIIKILSFKVNGTTICTNCNTIEPVFFIK
jgi:hypothetical protein